MKLSLFRGFFIFKGRFLLKRIVILTTCAILLCLTYSDTIEEILEEYTEENDILQSNIYANFTCDKDYLTSMDSLIDSALSFRTQPPRFFYNRIPKCGSRSVQKVLSKLESRRNIKSESSPVTHHQRLNEYEERKEVKRINRMPTPVIYDRHCHFLDFEKYGLPQPIYINVARDPVERFISHYNFIRFESVDRDKYMSEERKRLHLNDCVMRNDSECSGDSGLIVKEANFFCGQSPVCRNHSSDMVALAKQNIEKHYAVVGISEDLGGFFEILQNLFPKPFFHAKQIYKRNAKSAKATTKTSKKKYLPSAEVREELRKRMVYDYEIYEFIKSRYERLLCYVRQSNKKKLTS